MYAVVSLIVGAAGAGVAARRVARAGPHRSGGVEEDRAARLVLVVEVELAGAAGAVVVPAVDVVRVEAEDVAGVVRVAEVDADEPARTAVQLIDRPAGQLST